jgi:Na+/melibiose symporter-like transporter
VFKKLFNKAKSVVNDEVRLHWKHPKKGEYVPYKEVANYSVGLFGREFLVVSNSVFGLAATNLLIAFVIQIRPMHIVLMATVFGLLNSLVFPVIRAKLVDNTRTKWGRFRPYIAIFGFVVFGLSVLLAWLPYENMVYTEKLFWVFTIHVIHGLLAPLYFESISQLVTVITPNANERAKVMSISAIFYSLAPTITSSLLPLLAGLAFFDFNGYLTLSFYRYIIVPIGGIGLFFNLFAVWGTKERLVTEKKYVPKIPTFYGITLIFKNKYWWIQRGCGVLGFCSAWAFVLTTWMFMFRYQNLEMFALFQLPLGTATLVSLIICPFLIRKFSSVKVLMIHNLGVAVVWLLMWVVMGNMWLFMLLYYALIILWDITKVMSPVLNGNVKDFTQYQTGKRMDFTFLAAEHIMFPILALIAFVQPLFMEAFGFTGDANIFYDPALNQTYFGLLFLISAFGAVGGILLVIFFFDLNEIKHRQIIAALKYRACMRDMKDGLATSRQIKETVELIRLADEKAKLPPPDLKEYKRAFIAEFKRLKIKEGREKRKEYTKARNLWDEINSAKLLLEEQSKFETPFLQFKVALAEKLFSKSISELSEADPSFREYALSLPNKTIEEKKFRIYALRFAAKAKRMTRKIKRRFPNGLDGEFDMTALLSAADKKVELTNRKVGVIERNVTTEEEKAAQKAEVTMLHNELKSAKATVRSEEKKLMRYNIALWHYNSAKDLLDERDSFDRYHEVEELYENATVETEAEDEAFRQKLQNEKAEKAAEKERLLAEKSAKKRSR